MSKYAVKVQLGSKIWEEEVTAGDSNTARQIIQGRNPKSVILNVRKK